MLLQDKVMVGPKYHNWRSYGEEDYQAYGVTLFTPNDRFELFNFETMHDKSALKAYNQNFNAARVIPHLPWPNVTDFSGGLLACAIYPEAVELLLINFHMLKMIHSMMLMLKQMQLHFK